MQQMSRQHLPLVARTSGIRKAVKIRGGGERMNAGKTPPRKSRRLICCTAVHALTPAAIFFPRASEFPLGYVPQRQMFAGHCCINVRCSVGFGLFASVTIAACMICSALASSRHCGTPNGSSTAFL